MDIIHLIARQTTIDIFFIDWERPKAGHLIDLKICLMLDSSRL